ncbi:DNA-binding transcriptional activator of the SARP family [Kibdelosporangium aridum]|uniref:DNA-binding transcriptional activator of the SARP family n=2 Tax=Kibdelosporangium aridum TaxID=2030 RepID=A0A1Y5Y970_KIBAR|nr:DNA-binding transcriptional activator of the SARP family [Kibdelosporangium aridum]
MGIRRWARWMGQHEGGFGLGSARAIASVLDSAGGNGISLVGPGAVSAVRALLVHVLSESGSGLDRVVVPQLDLDLLLGRPFSRSTSAAMVVAPTFASALAYVDSVPGDVLLVCSPDSTLDDSVRRLQRAGGATQAVVLGGAVGRVIDVRADGRIERQDGRRLFISPQEVLSGLRGACNPGSSRVSRPRPVALRVLGRPRLELWANGVRRDVTDLLTSKQQELLVFLAVAPDGGGTRRESLNSAVWPGSPPTRPYNSLHNALSLLRRSILDASGGTIRDLVVRSGPFYRINRDIVDVDYWHFRGPESGRLPLFRGDLGEGIDSLWIDLPREAVRRQALDSATALLERDSHTSVAIDTLERLRSFDPYNEGIYREIARAQLKIGRVDAARRTYSLLVRMLLEIDQEPDSPAWARWDLTG